MNDNRKKAEDIVKRVQDKKTIKFTKTDQADRIVMHPLLGVLIFGFIMIGVFMISQTFLGPLISDILTEHVIGNFYQIVEGWLSSTQTSSFLSGLILEGIIGGFAAVIGFLPLIMVLFFFLQLLEDSGYMSRVAVVMDRFFKPIGLAGKSIIPMYVGTACSIPAIMSSRTIKNEKQRKLTVLLTPFVPCGAKLPVIALFITVFFGGSGFMTGLTYFLAIVVILLSGYLIRFLLDAKKSDKKFDEHSFIELPDYHIPSIKRAIRVMFDQAWDFTKKAATIIILMNGIVWITANFDWSFQMVDPADSILKTLAQPIAFLLTPLGFGVWGLAAAAVLGFIAKEEVVGALAVIFAFSVSDDLGVENIELTHQVLLTSGGLTAVSAYAFMAFNLFTPPCFAAIGAMNTELKSRKLTVLAVLFQLFVGYMVAMIIYQLGTLIVYQRLGDGFIYSIMMLTAVIVMLIMIKIKRMRVMHG